MGARSALAAPILGKSRKVRSVPSYGGVAAIKVARARPCAPPASASSRPPAQHKVEPMRPAVLPEVGERTSLGSSAPYCPDWRRGSCLALGWAEPLGITLSG